MSQNLLPDLLMNIIILHKHKHLEFDNKLVLDRQSVTPDDVYLIVAALNSKSVHKNCERAYRMIKHFFSHMRSM